MKRLPLRVVVAVAVSALAMPLLVASPAFANFSDDLVVHYALNEKTGSTAADHSGNNNDGSFVGNPALGGDSGVNLDGVDDHIALPNNILGGLDSITVSTEVLIRQEQPTPYFIFGLGNPASSDSGDGYLFATGNSFRASITTGNWSGEQTVNSNVNLDRGVWKTVTYTLDDSSDTARLYLDGKQLAEKTGVTIKPGEIGKGITTANYLGRSNYASDRYLAGSVRDFRIYATALAADEIASLLPSNETRANRDGEELTLGDISAVQENLNLPTKGVNGSAISWASSLPGTISSEGTVTRPTPTDGNATVELTATITNGSVTKTKTFTATVLALLDDQSEVALAAQALTITNLEDVRGNITLPVVSGNVTIEWESSAPSVITTDGVVTRQSDETAVVLSATLRKGTATASREFAATVRKAGKTEPYEGYAFAYFTGDSLSGENIYLAASEGNNALDWRELNGGQPVLRSSEGTKGLRDPFLIRSPEGDTFYLIATDLSIGGGTSWGSSVRNGSHYLEIWESSDLVHWSAQRHVKVAPDNAGNTWAPEAYYDETIGAYVVFWASSLYAENDPGHTGNSYHRMMYATTRDFVTFDEPQIWQDQGLSRIDSTVIKESDTYYRFTKDEGAGGTGCSDIIQESSTSLRATLDSWTMVDSCIGRDAGTKAVEGPTVFKSNPGDVNGEKFYLFVDEYGGRGYIPLETDDLANPSWKVSDSYDLPGKPRHGTVIPITAAELAELGEGPAAPPANSDGQILAYDFNDGPGTDVLDKSGNNQHGVAQGNPTWSEGGTLNFDGVDDYVKLPDNILARVEDVSIQAFVWIDSDQAGSYFIYGLGNTLSGVGNGYLFTTGNAYRTSLATGNWTTEQTVSQGQNLARGRWAALTYVLRDTTAIIYLDGIEVGRATVTADPGDIGGGITTANYLGRSNYDADKKFKGKMRNFEIYNRALSPAEVLSATGNYGAMTGVSLREDVLKVAPIINTETREVTFPVRPGTDLSALTPVFEIHQHSIAMPESGTTYDLSVPVTVAVVGPPGAPATLPWTLRAVEMTSPTIPGLYADPNIVAFGDTYYIYATSDGYPGWGGKEFYVWKSKDLVSWERGTTPFLTLDGASGNVPWATGNAWAPTIAEKNGKFYFYFSGHNAELNRKTIGVAVADHPEGPFVAQPKAMILNNEAVTSGQAIDPATFTDPVTGKDYLFWGNGSAVYGELADDMLSIKPGTFKRINGLTDFREGLFLNYREGLYHLTYSIDDTGSTNYRVGYATSTSVDGPWTYQGVILQKDASQGILAAGHSSILNVPGTDDWYIAYHRFAMPGGNGNNRETTVDRLTFNPATGLMNVVTPTLTGVPAQTIVDPDPMRVSISGTAKVGETLTASVNDPWAATGFTWMRDNAVIGSATGASYVLATADEGATITVRVDAAKTLWTPSSAEASAGPVVPADVDPLPVITATVNGPAANGAGWRSGPVTIAMALNDGAASGSAALGIQYRVDGGDWTNYNAPVEVKTDGVHVVAHRVTADGAAIAGTEGSTSVQLDGVAPESVAVVDPDDGLGTTVSPVTLKVTATDETSGVAAIEYRIADGNWVAMPVDGLRFLEVGTKVVSYRATDMAGNAEAARTVVVTITDGGSGQKGTLTLESTVLVAGGTFTVRGSGFTPGERVEFTLFSSPVHLGSVQANESGAFSATLLIPSGTELGAHTLRGSGISSGVVAEIAITVVAPGAVGVPGSGGGGLPITGFQLAAGLGVALACLAIGGAALLVRRRRVRGFVPGDSVDRLRR